LAKCEFARGKISPNFTHLLLECLGPKVPYTVLVSLASEKVHILEDNKDTQTKLDKVDMPTVEFKEFKLSGSPDTPARVKLILPPCFDENKKSEYPLIVDLYGGPGVQFVTQKWRQHSREGIDYYLAGKKNYIVAKIDVRGTSFSGDAFHHAVYEKLGIVERDDTIEVIKNMVDNLGYIDKSRVAVWGWSYGGYLTAQILAKQQNLVKCGIAIAPVSQWELYDSGYTERYMGYPTSVGETPGYPEDSGLRTKGSSFKGKNLYLVHGSADDNVHIQNTDILSQALVKENIQFKLQIYPGANHDLNYMDLDGNSVDALKHLYTSMEDFFDKDCNFADENSKAREIERLKEELRVLKQS
jgi:dipeptidyl-peptidase-4